MAQIRRLAEQEGMKASEIAARLDIRVRRVWRIAASRGIAMAEAGGRRRVSAYLTRKHISPLDAIAKQAGLSRSALVSRILSSALEENGRGAVRLLGKRINPKRPYRKRKRSGEPVGGKS